MNAYTLPILIFVSFTIVGCTTRCIHNYDRSSYTGVFCHFAVLLHTSWSKRYKDYDRKVKGHDKG